MKKPSSATTLFCFSPPVMIATFVIEGLLALYTLLRYRGPVARLVAVILLCLASFQLAEYLVCVGPASQWHNWTIFGLIGITFLPALGVHLAGLLTKRTPLIGFGYGVATTLSAAFLLQPEVTDTARCLGNYVLIHIHNPLIYKLHSWYYAVFLAITLIQLLLGSRLALSSSRQLRQARVWLLVGIFSFVGPMAIVLPLYPIAHGQGSISIMCGFAIILALILAWRVVPLVEATNQK